MYCNILAYGFNLFTQEAIEEEEYGAIKSMRAKLHMYAMKFKPAIKKYREAWRADPDRYEELNRCLRECRIRLFGIWGVTATTSYMGYLDESCHADERKDDY